MPDSLLCGSDVEMEYAIVSREDKFKPNVNRNQWGKIDYIEPLISKLASEGKGLWVAAYIAVPDNNSLIYFPRIILIDIELDVGRKRYSFKELSVLDELKQALYAFDISMRSAIKAKEGKDYRWIFSGAKGFHLDINPWSVGLSEGLKIDNTLKKSTNEILKAFMIKFIEELRLPMYLDNFKNVKIDYSIYDATRLIRYPVMSL